ncbi:MAG: hypothetical protein IJT66_03820, partial [Clostridia bacterium]|nr:hypothetical protein [Clostridia bacterium]
MTTTISVGKTDRESLVSERLFGCNMEPTRRTFWGGLSAQMINNRKFYALKDGGFAGFETIGSVLVGTDCKKSICQSNYPVIENGAIIQSSKELTAQSGRAYQLRFWIENTEDVCITVRWGDAFQTTIQIAGKHEPQEQKMNFTAVQSGEFPFSFEVEGKIALSCLSLMPDDHLCGMRRDVIELLAQARISILRFPGGCYAEAYDWKQGLLPTDRRPPVATALYNGDFLQRNTYGQECHEIGTEEFMVLCEAIGAEPALTVPIIEKDVQNTTDWVEYCLGGAETKYGALRIARGHFKPCPVKTWFIGNEVYFFGKTLAENGDLAGKREAEFIRAIKQAAPDVRVIVGCSPYREEWTAASLKHCAAE